jgi:phage terminase large subunit-like protein
MTDHDKLSDRIRDIIEDSAPEMVRVALMPAEDRAKFLENTSMNEAKALPWEWEKWARKSQIAPEGDWLTWLILAGRGWGKTRAGAEWCHERVQDTYGRLHLVGATASDARDIMIEGPSGILSTPRPWNKVTYSPTKRLLTWENGAVGLVFSADEPERLRGEQCEAAWSDELAAWRYPEAWSQLQLGLRLGPLPRNVVTTTPRPTKEVKQLAAAPTTHVTRGITYENIFNLAPAFIQEVIRVYEGTRFGRQELYADILDDAPGALWTHDGIQEWRITKKEAPEKYDRFVVAVDPAVSFSSESSETGIVVVGKLKTRAYVLADHTARLKPEQWAKKVCDLSNSYDNALVVAEKNQGGDMVEHTIHVYDPTVPVKLVSATKAKLIRAEPVATAYERGMIRHVGNFDKLEDQMCSYEPGFDKDSPDRLDALVWAMTELVVSTRPSPVAMLGMNTQSSESYWAGVAGEKQTSTPWLSPG